MMIMPIRGMIIKNKMPAFKPDAASGPICWAFFVHMAHCAKMELGNKKPKNKKSIGNLFIIVSSLISGYYEILR